MGPSSGDAVSPVQAGMLVTHFGQSHINLFLFRSVYHGQFHPGEKMKIIIENRDFVGMDAPLFIVSPVTIAKRWKLPKRSFTDDEADGMCSHGVEGKGVPTHRTTWMNLEEIALRETSQSTKRPASYGFTYMRDPG